MSLRMRLMGFMLVVSLVPMLLFASVALGRIRQTTLDTAMETSAALFESKMLSYEAKTDRLYNTGLDIISNLSLWVMLRPTQESSFTDMSSFRRWQIVTTSKEVQNGMKSHAAAQRDLIEGISLVLKGSTHAAVTVGSFVLSPEAIDEAMRRAGVPVLYADVRDGQTKLQVCISFYSQYPSAGMLGTCVINLRQDVLFETLLPGDIDEGTMLFVRDENQRTLFHSGAPAENPDFAELPPDEGMHVYFAEEKGETYIVTCQRTFSNPDWIVYYALPYNYFLRASSQLTNIVLPFVLLCGILAVLAALSAAWNVYRPIRDLTRSIREMRGGDLRRLPLLRAPQEIELLVRNFNMLVEDINHLLARVEQESANARRAEMVALRAQISPHFLYNTLNGIKCMAALGQTEEIQISVTSLIALLRASLGNTRDVVPLRTELTHVANYVQLQRYRLDLRFAYHVHVPEALHDLAVPHFVLQPLVENALIHAFPDINNERNAIEVSAYTEGDLLFLSVEDNGMGIERARLDALNAELASEESTWLDKVGLHNVIERCRSLFGKEVQLYMVNTGEGTQAVLVFPRMECEAERETAGE